MNIYANNFPQEKIHIHFDKKVYNAGETIWFKAYIFTGADPSISSKNFYAELSDPDGNILQRKVYPVLESTTAGRLSPSSKDSQERSSSFQGLYHLDDEFRYGVLL